MMRLSIISALLVLAALLASPAAVVGQQQNWTFCAVIQSSQFYSVISAIVTSNQTSPLTLGGIAGGYFAVNAVGSRSFYNLTMAATPTLTQTAQIVSLDAPGSVGGNDDLFWPALTQKLNGNGLTFRFNQIPLIDGQINNPAATQSLNFWWDSGNFAYDEENAGGTHETKAWASSLVIATTTTTTLPTCAPQATVQFFFCLAIVGPTYQTVFSGLLTTNGLAQPFSATSSNQLPGRQQGVSVTAATGIRRYTDLTTGATSVLSVTSLMPQGTFVGNTNFLYPSYAVATDWNGIAFQMNDTVPIAGQTIATSNKVVFWYESSLGQFLEEGASGAHEATPSFSSFTVTSYNGGSLPSCSIPVVAGAPIYYSFCAQLISSTFTTVFSGMLTLQNIPFVTTSGDLRYLVVAASGTRSFTDAATGKTTINNIVSLAPVGSLGGNTNFLYINSTNWLDGDGLTFYFDGNPPIAGQALAGNTLNFWYGGSEGRYLEEVQSGTHESTPATSSMVAQIASVGAAVPTCALPVSNLGANLRQWAICGTMQSATFTSAIAAILTTNSTQVTYNSKPAYFVVNATGSRTFTNLTTSAMAQQVSFIQYLDPPGSTGGNTNYIFPSLTPRLDGDGLTFHMNTIPLIDGQTTDSISSPTINYWYTTSDLSYLEENAGGRHEMTPFQSTLSIVPYTPVLGAGPMCNIPSTIDFNFCFILVGSTFSTVFSGVITTDGIATPVVPDSFNQLTSTQQGFTVLGATGTRVYTNISTGAVSKTSIVSVAPRASFIGNGNVVYPRYQVATDWNGVAFVMDGPVAIAGEPNGGNTFVLWYQKALSQYLEETQSSMHESTPTSSSFTLNPATGNGAVCAIPSQPVLYYSFCSVIGSTNQFSSVMTGVLTLQANALIIGGKNAYRVTAANGTRTYTDATGKSTTNKIVSLAPVGDVGGNTNYLYIGSTPVLDGDGITFIFDSIPPIYAEPASSTHMNWWFNSGTNSYLEETASGTHEGTPSYNSSTIAQYTGSLITCGSPSVNPTTSSSSDSSLSGGAIAGIVIGVVVGASFILAICLVVLCGLCKPKDSKLQNSKNSDETEGSEESQISHTDIEMQ